MFDLIDRYSLLEKLNCFNNTKHKIGICDIATVKELIENEPSVKYEPFCRFCNAYCDEADYSHCTECEFYPAQNSN